jgi:aspartate racemase
MKPKSIGIIGGAGPLAGAFLLKRVLSLAGELYGCYRDRDFPKIFLISFPFSEMLSTNLDEPKLRKELSECLYQLRKNGASILAIACNTLHAFLEEKDDLSDLVHLPGMLTEILLPNDKPVVFCTSTSAQFKLHQQFFPCSYPDPSSQGLIDEQIDRILKGENTQNICKTLEKLIQEQVAKTVILGCTELSLFSKELSVPNKNIIDPLEELAYKILEMSFLQS